MSDRRLADDPKEVEREARFLQFQQAEKRYWQNQRTNGPDPDATEKPPPLTLAEWLARDLPEPDRLLGDLLTATCRVLIVGPTGLGKTMFGLAVAMAL
jgi:SpoVK/Ycf46/Vps4 family AAA+-type ATPase